MQDFSPLEIYWTILCTSWENLYIEDLQHIIWIIFIYFMHINIILSFSFGPWHRQFVVQIKSRSDLQKWKKSLHFKTIQSIKKLLKNYIFTPFLNYFEYKISNIKVWFCPRADNGIVYTGRLDSCSPKPAPNNTNLQVSLSRTSKVSPCSQQLQLCNKI